MKLSVRLFVLVLIAALPIFAMQVHGLLQDRAQRKAAIAEQALSLARLAAAQQDQFIEGARYLLAAAAQLPDVREHNPPHCSLRLGEILQLFPTISGLGAVDADGHQFCSGSGREPINIGDRDYFRRAVERKTLAISGFIIGRRSGEPQLNFAYPALDAAGEVAAVVILAIDLKALSLSLSGTPLPEGATISLVDGNGVLLARAPPEPEWIGQRAREAAFTRTMLTRREGVMEARGIDNVERLHGFAPLLASADLFAVVGPALAGGVRRGRPPVLAERYRHRAGLRRRGAARADQRRGLDPPAGRGAAAGGRHAWSTAISRRAPGSSAGAAPSSTGSPQASTAWRARCRRASRRCRRARRGCARSSRPPPTASSRSTIAA